MGESVQELFAGHMFRPVPSIGERIPGLPAWLASLVSIMLAKKRDERPTSMQAVARALAERGRATPVAPRVATSRWGGRAAPIVVAVAGLSALAAALGFGGGSNRRRSMVSASQAAVLPAAPVSEREMPAIAPPAVVVPTQTAASIPPVDIAPAPPQPRRRARTAERPQQPARSAPPPAVSGAKQMVETDGIVDL
jgi:hypothetical protein